VRRLEKTKSAACCLIGFGRWYVVANVRLRDNDGEVGLKRVTDQGIKECKLHPAYEDHSSANRSQVVSGLVAVYQCDTILLFVYQVGCTVIYENLRCSSSTSQIHAARYLRTALSPLKLPHSTKAFLAKAPPSILSVVSVREVPVYHVLFSIIISCTIVASPPNCIET
jgi:hypothetical protein